MLDAHGAMVEGQGLPSVVHWLLVSLDRASTGGLDSVFLAGSAAGSIPTGSRFDRHEGMLQATL